MLGESGSIASIAGLLVSLSGLGFALLQLSRLRGEARAAREAAEETRQLLRRDSAGTDLTRIGERIQGLIEIHRSGDRARALDRYPEIYRLLIEIRRNHPNLDEEYRGRLQQAIARLQNMQGELEGQESGLSLEQVQRFNRTLNHLQATLLAELEDRLG